MSTPPTSMTPSDENIETAPVPNNEIAARTFSGTLGSIALLAISSNLTRKAAFTGLMYFAGGTVISTVGLMPTILAGTVIMLL